MSNAPGPIQDFLLKCGFFLCIIFTIIGAVFYNKSDQKDKNTGKSMFYIASGFIGCLALILLIARLTKPGSNMNVSATGNINKMN